MTYSKYSIEDPLGGITAGPPFWNPDPTENSVRKACVSSKTFQKPCPEAAEASGNDQDTRTCSEPVFEELKRSCVEIIFTRFHRFERILGPLGGLPKFLENRKHSGGRLLGTALKAGKQKK